MASETPKYVSSETGKSTELAEKVAARFDKMQVLKDVIAAQNFPKKEGLNWGSYENPYKVKGSDTKGVLELLKNNLQGSELDDENYIRIAYAHLFKYVKD